MFEEIVNDIEIQKIYEQIKEEEDRQQGWAYHGENHVRNVYDIVKQVLNELNVSKEIIEDAGVAVALHDLGCIQGKDDHEKRSYQMAKEYIEKKQLAVNDKDMILEAIRNHRNGFDTDNIITIALIFADKLDIKKERIAKAGYQVKGMRQMQYIEDIKISIKDGELIVAFITSKQINIEELNQFYFMDKVRKAIYSFAKKMQLETKIYGI